MTYNRYLPNHKRDEPDSLVPYNYVAIKEAMKLEKKARYELIEHSGTVIGKLKVWFLQNVLRDRYEPKVGATIRKNRLHLEQSWRKLNSTHKKLGSVKNNIYMALDEIIKTFGDNIERYEAAVDYMQSQKSTLRDYRQKLDNPQTLKDRDIYECMMGNHKLMQDYSEAMSDFVISKVKRRLLLKGYKSMTQIWSNTGEFNDAIGTYVEGMEVTIKMIEPIEKLLTTIPQAVKEMIKIDEEKKQLFDGLDKYKQVSSELMHLVIDRHKRALGGDLAEKVEEYANYE